MMRATRDTVMFCALSGALDRTYSLERSIRTIQTVNPAKTLQHVERLQEVRSDQPTGYGDFLAAVVARIEKAQRDAAAAINTATILLYYDLGTELLQRQAQRGWGAGVIRQLARDLGGRFPGSRGYSERNLHYMRAFAAAWPDRAVVDTILSRVTWWHNLTLLSALSDPAERAWYAERAGNVGWSRNVMLLQIESELYRHEGRAVTNFAAALSAEDSDLAQAIFRDHYVLEVSGLRERVRERDVESALLQHMRNFFLALGTGFALVGSQYPIQVGGETFSVDLLFYHVGLGRYVVVDLKTTDFRPQYVGQMGFYLEAVDALLPNPAAGRSSVGIVLCRRRNVAVAEFALRSTRSAMGVATFETREALPAEVRESLPTVEQLQGEYTRALGKQPGTKAQSR
jgi:predicted nuclease of restriction endonuclease-like (RecB) superfamily